MSKLDSYKSKPPDIVGSTTINHAARIKLALNCSEYVLLDHLSRKEEKRQIADTLTVYIATGFTEEETKRIFNSLVVKGFVFIKGPDDYELTSKWDDAFPDIEKEFDNYFWKEVISDPGSKLGTMQIAWTGTRKKALEHYIKLRKRYSKEFLVKQRNDYFEFLKLQKKLRNFDQQRLMGQVFLNPSSERFLEDYANYVKQLKEKYGDPDEPKPEPITRDQVNSSYGKNNNE